jgi:hypothetical protein
VDRDTGDDQPDPGNLQRRRDLSRTRIPTTVAVAGNNASMSAKLPRARRAMASWSQT